MINSRLRPGLTLIEIIMVIAIIVILGAATTPFLSSFVLRNNTETSQDKVISSIRKAQNYAMNGKSNATWGVCISSNSVRMYSGSCSSPTTSEDFDIPSTVTITNLNDTTFSKRRGEPSAAMSVTVSSSIETKTITVNTAGGMEIN